MRWKTTGEMEINVGVLGTSNAVLWEFRDYLVEVEAESDYKLNMVLAKDQETIFRVMSFMSGGFDLMIVQGKLSESKYMEITNRALTANENLRILFQMNPDTDFAGKRYPHVLFVPERDKLKAVTKQKINQMVAEKMTKEESVM